MNNGVAKHGCFQKWWENPPNHPILIGFGTIIFTIQFWGPTRYPYFFGWHPCSVYRLVFSEICCLNDGFFFPLIRGCEVGIFGFFQKTWHHLQLIRQILRKIWFPNVNTIDPNPPWKSLLFRNPGWSIFLWRKTNSANGPWDKSLNFMFPTRHVIPESLKSGHWLSENMLIYVILIYPHPPFSIWIYIGIAQLYWQRVFWAWPIHVFWNHPMIGK